MSISAIPFFDVFLLYYLLPLILIVGGILMQRVKQNEWFGLRTPATLSDPEIWEKANKVMGVSFLLLGGVFLFFNSISYLLRWTMWIQVGLIIVLPIGIAIFGLIYSDKLKREKAEVTLKLFVVSKNFLYAMTFISIFMAITGILLFHKVNRISGIGFILIGIVFSVLFFKDSSMEPELRTKNFNNHFLWFIVITILLSFISVGLAYI